MLRWLQYLGDAQRSVGLFSLPPIATSIQRALQHALFPWGSLVDGPEREGGQAAEPAAAPATAAVQGAPRQPSVRDALGLAASGCITDGPHPAPAATEPVAAQVGMPAREMQPQLQAAARWLDAAAATFMQERHGGVSPAAAGALQQSAQSGSRKRGGDGDHDEELTTRAHTWDSPRELRELGSPAGRGAGPGRV